jgi:enoyl-CoA hydratase/carnithine racemase
VNDLLLIEKRGDVTSLQLNRPSKANALSDALVRALQHTINAAAANGTRVLSIQGAGNNFCAGFDLSSLDDETDETLIDRLQRAETLLQSLYHAPFATVALIHGGAHGAGFDLAMCCDYRIAMSGARFRMPSWRMGIAIGTRRLVSRVGEARTFALLRAASTLDVTEAHATNAITEIADHVTWQRRVDEIHSEVIALPARGYERLKRIVLRDTQRADIQDLLESLQSEPLKQRMQNYVNNKL